MRPLITRKPHIPSGIHSLLADLVHERIGVFFDVARHASLVEKVEPLALDRECHSMLDYYYILKYEESSSPEWMRVMDALSVQETYFWREFGQIESLVTTFVPAWFQTHSEPLKIWSAASASGEEAFTIAIALAEAGWGSHPIEIYGSDASQAAVTKSSAGIYREKAFRTLPLQLKRKYFSPRGKEWELSSEIRDRVRFQRANLLDRREISSLAQAPAIFCRNVFIYFSHHSIRQTLASFAARMPRGGWLMVGASESLLRLTADFELREISGSFVYVRV